MSDLQALLAKVELATGANREIDARIAVALGDVIMRGDAERGFAFFHPPINRGDWAFLSGCKNGEDDAYSSLSTCLSLKPYTASIDAAVKLVTEQLPGWEWLVRSPVEGEVSYFCNLTRWDFLGKHDTVVVEGDTAYFSAGDYVVDKPSPYRWVNGFGACIWQTQNFRGTL